MSRDVDAAATLIDELARAASRDTGCTLDFVRPFMVAAVRHLQREYGAQQIYIAAEGKKLPIAEILDAFRVGSLSVRAICRRYRISRRTLYRLVENGA